MGLKLGRTAGQTIVLPTAGVEIKFEEIRRGRARVDVAAPGNTPIVRGELLQGREPVKASRAGSAKYRVVLFTLLNNVLTLQLSEPLDYWPALQAWRQLQHWTRLVHVVVDCEYWQTHAMLAGEFDARAAAAAAVANDARQPRLVEVHDDVVIKALFARIAQTEIATT